MQAFWWGGKIDLENPKIISVYDALKPKLGENFTLGYERGCDWSATNETAIIREGDPRTERLNMMLMESSDPTNWKAAIKLASESDVVIAALGENPTLCGEARQRKGIRLPGDQERFLKELIATGKPVVLMMFGGRPQVIDEVEAGCAAILQAWYPGEEGEMLLLISCWVMLILPENFVSVILRQKVKNFIVIIMVFLKRK